VSVLAALGSAATDGATWGDLAAAIGLTILACLPLGISLWALLDAARRPRWVWALSRHPQTPWMAAIVAGVLLTVIGLLISLWYLIRVRPDLRRIERGELEGTVRR
jgi:hypothetical protein